MNSEQNTGYWHSVWAEFKKDRLALISLGFVFVLCFVAVFEDFLAGNRPIVLVEEGRYYFPVLFDYPELFGVDIKDKYLENENTFTVFPPVKYSPTENDLFSVLSPPTQDHYLGTDDRGRDVLSRMIHGARVSLSIGVVAVGIALLIGIFLGSLAGFYAGTVDFII